MLNQNGTAGRFSYAISTMGCKANLTDSQALEARLQRMGGVAASEEEAELFLLNTCTVTDQADKEARAILRKGKSGFTIATGCLAEVDPAQLSSVSLAEERKVRVVRNSAKDQLESVVAEWLAGMVEEQKGVVTGDRPGWHKKILENRDPSQALAAANRTRAFYKVQDGCNAFCSYCVIPLARGRSRSLPAAQVVREVQAIADSGVKEIVLTAIHAADYESDGLDFTGLVEKVLETNVPRLRLTSLDPAEIPDRLLDLMLQNSRLCPHFHVSLQSANGRVLSAMKRGYGAAEIEERFHAIQEKIPHAYIGMDLIAGFPGETDEEFEEGLLRLEKLSFTKAHVFPFSVRRNTAAARLVEAGIAVPAQVIHHRAARLRALSEKKFRASLESKIGSMAEVLVEEKRLTVSGRFCSTGHARNFHKVLIPGSHEPNKLYRARIVGVHQDLLKGELV